jgi:hypothetical protein
MSLTATNIFALIDVEVKTNTTTYPLATKVLDINVALDDAIDLAIRSCGIGQYDDTNFTDYPIITTNLVSAQRDYSYTQDGSGNLVLDIYKVMVMNPSGVYEEIPQVDMQSYRDTEAFYDGLNITGQPTSYDRTGNGIIFDVIPNYSQTNGLKMFINREGSYFTTSDTTKKPGIDGRLHEYLVVAPACKYAQRNSLSNESILYQRKLLLEKKISEVYSKKDRGVRKILSKTPFDFGQN